jgi:hypothetical protein
LAQNAIGGVAGFHAVINRKIAIGDWTMPDVVIAFAKSNH